MSGRPLIIIGTGRCGSTALHRLLSFHPHLAFLSQWCARFPNRPGVNRCAMQLLSLPVLRQLAAKHVRTSEAYSFWNLHFGGFASPCRDLMADDVPDGVILPLRAALEAMLTRTRTRLVIKITGWPRVGFLLRILPNAQFVHMYRDGRAVATSLMRRPWWTGWQGIENWKWGRLTPDQMVRWGQAGCSFEALAGLEWEILMGAFERATSGLSEQELFMIRYEHFCQDKVGTLKRLAEFADLSWIRSFESAVLRFPVVNANDKWRTYLNSTQQERLERILEPALREWGYL